MSEPKPNLIIRFRKWMVIAIAIGAMMYLGGAVATDIGRVGDSLENFDWFILIPVCALTLLNYALRFVKWTPGGIPTSGWNSLAPIGTGTEST